MELNPAQDHKWISVSDKFGGMPNDICMICGIIVRRGLTTTGGYNQKKHKTIVIKTWSYPSDFKIHNGYVPTCKEVKMHEALS